MNNSQSIQMTNSGLPKSKRRIKSLAKKNTTEREAPSAKVNVRQTVDSKGTITSEVPLKSAQKTEKIPLLDYEGEDLLANLLTDETRDPKERIHDPMELKPDQTRVSDDLIK
jgi:hypothetical protein